MNEKINSLKKGKRGERSFRDKLREHGFSAERGRQYKGSPDSPDIICKDLPLHFECKHVERLDLYKAIDKAAHDAGELTPVVAHRRNRSEWYVTLNADAFLDIVRRSDIVIT
jgi:Holliday junction resolvase